MFRYSPSKQSVIIAALVILLCSSCLIGATLALFTSDPNDGTIGIVATSGDVEIRIVDTSGQALEDKALAFITTATNSTPYFEPGATFYTQGFQVKNTGDIPVNFSLSVSKDDKINMEEFDEAFEVWIVKQGEETPERLTNFKELGLKPGDSSAIYFLYVKMKETADNEFQGKIYTGIGVTVYAVQSNAKLED